MLLEALDLEGGVGCLTLAAISMTASPTVHAAAEPKIRLVSSH
jgi:hypothetical protein